MSVVSNPRYCSPSAAGAPGARGSVRWQNPEPMARYLSNRALGGGVLLALWLPGLHPWAVIGMVAATLVWGCVVFMRYDRPWLRRLYRAAGWALWTFLYAAAAVLLASVGWPPHGPQDVGLDLRHLSGPALALVAAIVAVRLWRLVRVLRDPDQGLYGASADAREVLTRDGVTTVRGVLFAVAGSVGMQVHDQLRANQDEAAQAAPGPGAPLLVSCNLVLAPTDTTSVGPDAGEPAATSRIAVHLELPGVRDSAKVALPDLVLERARRVPLSVMRLTGGPTLTLLEMRSRQGRVAFVCRGAGVQALAGAHHWDVLVEG